MAETFFLDAVATLLQSAGLAPAPARVGVVEPAAASDLPAVVLSLKRTERVPGGLGERASLITRGALAWTESIDLANPVLAAEPTFVLLDASRQRLILPHGGLVRSDGSDPGEAPLDASDITVAVGGVARSVVTGAPAGAEVRVEPRIGRLNFGSPLPAAGTVAVTYFLGQWEQRLERIAGVLRLDACAATPADVQAVSDAAIGALLAPEARTTLRRLQSLTLTALGSVGAPEGTPPFRRRSARFAFTFEREINRPDSSGGIIREIAVTSQLAAPAQVPGVIAGSTESLTILG